MKQMLLSDAAYTLICGLVHGSDDIDVETVEANQETWDEVRSKFPLNNYKPPEES